MRGTRIEDGWQPSELRRAGRRDLLVAVALAVATVVALGVHTYGALHTRRIEPRVVAWSSAAAFVVLGVLATRRLAVALGRLMTSRTARAAGAAVRLVVTAVGYLVVLFGFLGLIGVSVDHILVGGTVAGVVLGIAGQQSLSNVFAGFVLLLARPFTVGDHVRVRSGALNGPFEGVVLSMSLTYVTLFVDGGVLKVPNSAVLSSAVGLYPARDTGVVEAAKAAGAPFTPPQGTATVPGGASSAEDPAGTAAPAGATSAPSVPSTVFGGERDRR